MKNIIHYIVCILFCALSNNVYSQTFGGGDGSSSNPYLIKTVSHMQELHQYDWSNSVSNTPYFRLENDIDMAGIDWVPLNQADPYSKHLHFDGNKHVIFNLTCKEQKYASLFGVLCGSCKDLGLVNVDIVSTNGGGSFGGYIGLVSPSSNKYTGTLERCFATGRVEGFSAVGGLVGNLGKSKDGVTCIVRDCYSACDVIGTYEAESIQGGGARAGGLVGTAWNNAAELDGVIENCYATGTIHATKTLGAGGLVGFADAPIKNCISFNDSLINNIASGSVNGKIGFGAAYAHPTNTQAKCSNVWASNKGVMVIAGSVVNRSDFGNPSYSYLGEEKNDEELSLFNINSELGWDFTSDENIWSQTPSYGYPVLQWMSDRNDTDLISGHGTADATSLKDVTSSDLYISITNNHIVITSPEKISSIEVFSITGSKLSQCEVNSNQIELPFQQNNTPIIIKIITSSKVYTQKLIF